MLPFRLLVMFLLLPVLMPVVQAAPVAATAPVVRLHDAMQFVEDPQHIHTLDSIRQSSVVWTDNGTSVFNQGYSKSAWWLKLQLENSSDESLPRLLEVGYAALDHVDVFVLHNDVLQQHFVMGDKLPYAQRPVDHRFFMAPITLMPHQMLDVYVRVQSSGAVQAPLTLWEYGQFHSSNFTATILQGLYYGGILTIAIYNLLIFFVLGDRNYLYYVAFMLCTMMTLAAQSGLAFRFLWPDATTWNDLAIVFFTAATAGFAAIFTLRFLLLETLSRLLLRLMQGMGLFSVLLMVLCFVVPYHTIAVVILLDVIAVIALAVVAGSYALARGVPSARYYMLAWSILLVGALVVVLSRLGFLPVNLFTEYSTQLGSLLESILLSLALADRINTERRLRFKAQSDALHASQRANTELEQRVQERTSELEQLNQRLQQLSETDQLTGLANRRFLESRLQQEWSRCLRQQHVLTVMLLDIDFFKQVNDRYGHPAGDACLQQVARLIADGLRLASDTAARYGGEEFCLVLPETDADGAIAVAERIRRRIAGTQMASTGPAFSVTASIGLCAAIPAPDMTVEEFIRRADAALYQSKQAGRDRVTLAGV